jgi:hypothetical protein
MDKTLTIRSTDQLLHRIRSEYLEMPGLRLTCAQAQRLWGMDEQTCSEVLRSLTEARFLHRREDGAYARLADGAATFPPMRMVKTERSGASRGSTRPVASPRS